MCKCPHIIWLIVADCFGADRWWWWWWWWRAKAIEPPTSGHWRLTCQVLKQRSWPESRQTETAGGSWLREIDLRLAIPRIPSKFMMMTTMIMIRYTLNVLESPFHQPWIVEPPLKPYTFLSQREHWLFTVKHWPQRELWLPRVIHWPQWKGPLIIYSRTLAKKTKETKNSNLSKEFLLLTK